MNNDDTDGLSRMEYINSIKDKIPIDKYYELIFGEQERSYLEKEQDDNLDLVIRLAEGNYGANPDDFFKSLYKKGIIEADGLVNYFRGKSEDLVADALARVVLPATVRPPVVEALPSDVCPVTPNVPPTVWLPVTVEVPVVAVLAVRYVVTAFVVVLLPTIRLVKLASEAKRDEKNPVVEVLFVVSELVA